jgi:hypothetical protein
MQTDLVEEVDGKLSEMVSEVLQEIEQASAPYQHRYILVDDGPKYKNRM